MHIMMGTASQANYIRKAGCGMDVTRPPGWWRVIGWDSSGCALGARPKAVTGKYSTCARLWYLSMHLPVDARQDLGPAWCTPATGKACQRTEPFTTGIYMLSPHRLRTAINCQGPTVAMYNAEVM